MITRELRGQGVKRAICKEKKKEGEEDQDALQKQEKKKNTSWRHQDSILK